MKEYIGVVFMGKEQHYNTDMYFNIILDSNEDLIIAINNAGDVILSPDMGYYLKLGESAFIWRRL